VNVNVYIERLVLDGVNIRPGQGALVKTAVEAELSRLLTNGGLATGLEAGGALSSVRANSFQISEDSNPSQLGKQIARSVYGGIGK
jgi:hypothetical protein